MIFDPYCSYSVRAFDELKPYVAAGRIQLAIVPICKIACNNDPLRGRFRVQ